MITTRRLATLALVVAILLCAAPAAPAVVAASGEEPSRDWRELVAAERAFARASVERGMRTAFLEFLAEGSVVFRPHAVDARSWFEERPEVEGTLDWKPIVAEVSADGRLGYTSGPWTFTTPDGKAAHGHYVSVWGRQADDSWRVLLDLGNSHDDPGSVSDAVAQPRRRSAKLAAGTAATAGLRATDKALAELAARDGLIRAYRTYAAKNLRLYRNGAFPATDRKSARKLLDDRSAPRTWEVTAVGAAESGDLGYSYGTMATGGHDQASEREGYARLWHRGRSGDWRLILDVSVPLP